MDRLRPPRVSPQNGRSSTKAVPLVLLREVNDRIRDVGQGYDFPGAGLEFLCECGSPDCVETVELPPEAYDRLRLGERAYVIAAGHERVAAG